MGIIIREKPKGSGTWWLFLNHQGHRRSKKIGRDKKLAKEVAKKIEAKLALEGIDVFREKAPTPLFEEYCILWLDDYIKPTRRATTYQRYKQLLALHINPVIGKMPIDRIKRADVRQVFLDIYGKGLSKSTVSAAKNVISGIFEYAIDEELVHINPTGGLLKKLGLDNRADRKQVQPLSPDEVSLLLTVCLKHWPKWYPLFLCAFRTGMRLGEILGLHWGDINWNEKYILVQRSFRHGRVTRTKSKKSRRVDMSDQLQSALRALMKQRKKEALREGTGKIVEIVFHTKGGYTAQNSVRNVWLRILGKAGLNKVKLHVTRHTFASILLSRGESPVYVKEQLGHSSIQMTVDIYGHLIPSGNREAVNSLDKNEPIRTLSAPAKSKKAVTD